MAPNELAATGPWRPPSPFIVVDYGTTAAHLVPPFVCLRPKAAVAMAKRGQMWLEPFFEICETLVAYILDKMHEFDIVLKRYVRRGSARCMQVASMWVIKRVGSRSLPSGAVKMQKETDEGSVVPNSLIFGQLVFAETDTI